MQVDGRDVDLAAGVALGDDGDGRVHTVDVVLG
jgi:hypothetical protein